MVSEYDFSFCAFFFDQAFVVFYIVNACEGVFDVAECFAVFIQRQYVCVRVYAAFIQYIHIEQVVTYFVGRIAQHQNYFLRAFCDTSQADRKTVSAEDGEYNTNSFAAQFCFYVCSDIFCFCIVTCCTGNNCFCYSDYVFFLQFEAILFSCCQNGICYDFYDIVAFANDGCFNTSGNCTCHSENLLLYTLLIRKIPSCDGINGKFLSQCVMK